MGLQIKIKGADFSQSNLGIIGIASAYFTNGNIGSAGKKLAIAKFIRDFEAFGFTSKFDYIRIFCNTALSDRLNVLNPLDTDAANRAVFMNDADYSGHIAHTNQGWEPYAAGVRWVASNYKIPAGVHTNFHMHAYATSPETNSTLGCYFNCRAAANGNSIFVTLQRNVGGVTRTMLARNNTVAYAETTGISGNIGLLSGAINAGTVKLYDNGSQVATKSEPLGFTSVGDVQLEELIGNTVQASSISGSRTLFTGAGRGAWTDADEANLNTILNTLKTDLATT